MKNQLSILGNGSQLMFPRMMKQMRRDWGRVFEDGWPDLAASDSLMEAAFEPSVDVMEDKDQIIVRAELPGMAREDIKLSMEDGVLSIEGEKKQESVSHEGGLLRRERSYGSFSRTFTLPGGVDASKAVATYKDGVLELKLPKKEESKPRAIEISIK